MKQNTLILFFLLLGTAVFGQEYYFLNEDCMLNKKIKNIDLVHVIANFEGDSTYTNQDKTIGKIEKYPKVLSKKYHKDILRSREIYDTRDYASAARVLEKPYQKEPNNPFIANDYARALYWIDSEKEKSFSVYKKLIDQLDKENGTTDELLTIDLWFREAYWKLGTLYMDKKMWLEAFELINKFLVAIRDEKGEPVYIQALEYLTECTYMMYNDNLAKHFAERTLHYDSTNKYTKDILEKLKKEITTHNNGS